MKKLSKKKYILIISILFILFILRTGLHTFFTFDINAEDLVHLGSEKIKEIKDNIIKTSFSAGSLKFDFMMGIGVYIPVLLAILGYDYEQLKSKNLKFNIGKNNLYQTKIRKEKLKLAFLGTLNVVFIYAFIMGISLIFGKTTEYNRIYDELYFKSGSILEFLFGSDVKYAIFTILSVAISTFLGGILAFSIIDYKGYIKGILIYLSYMWIGSILMYSTHMIPKPLIPMHSIMGITSRVTMISLIISYISIFIPVIILKRIYKYEVN